MIQLIKFLVLIATCSANSINYSAKEHLLPALFHLDDYDRCLADKAGLYCLGDFDLTPAELPNPTFDLMQEYSNVLTNYNRTRIHRGYCVSARCPSSERNATLRFERCAASWTLKRSLDATLRSLQYCHRPAQVPNSIILDTPTIIFAVCLGVIISLNIVGTVYDVNTQNGKPNNLWLSWSLRYNWRRLTVLDSSDKSRFFIGHGVRVMLMVILVVVHNALLQHTTYLQNPIFIEQVSRHSLTMIIQNGTSSAQIYVILATFLGSYQLLKSAPDGKIGLTTFRKHILKRIFRLAPVHIFVVGFAATWWRWLDYGPLWPAVVGAESEVCRRKFWSHALLISNLVEPEVSCLVPTWFVSADLQLYIVGAIFTVLLARVRHAISILVVMFLASTSLIAALAYVNNWTAMMYVTPDPENIRALFRNNPSYYNFYITPWGGLPTCFLGLIAAHYYTKLSAKKTQEETSETQPEKSLNVIVAMVLFLAVFGWLLSGNFIKHVKSRLFLSIYAAIERSMFLVIATISGLALHQVSSLNSILSWSGWTALSRLSLSVMLVHWGMNLTLIAHRTHLVNVSAFTVIMDGVSICFCSYLLAVPLTLLVELPMQMFLDTILA